MAIAAFDLSAFRTRYAEFSSVDQTLLNAFFLEACIYCNNTDGSVIRDLGMRSMILNMLVAHIAELNSFDMVGRVSDVTVGGIPVHTMYVQPAGSRAWYDQTKYGAAAWMAMSPFRRALYIPAYVSE